jgi:hypothetical protein
VNPATESFVAVTVCPVFVASPSAVSGGYGRQSQFVPRGTESPNATIDHDAPDVPVEEDGFERRDDAEQAVVAQVSATRAKTTQPSRRLPMPEVILHPRATRLS